MSSRGGFRGGFGGRGRGRGRGRRGRGRGRGRGGRGRGRGQEWVPVTKLGRLVQQGLIKDIDEIFSFALPIKEHQIVETLIGAGNIEEEVMKVKPVQKQTRAGQRTRFKAWAIVGDKNGHVGLGVKCSKEVSISIKAALILAKIAMIPIRRGYWGSSHGLPHTVPCKVTGKCGSVRFRLIPAPRGTGIVAAVAIKKFLGFAGLQDVYTSSTGCTRTLGNFLRAAYIACLKTYSYLTPDLWGPNDYSKLSPYQEHAAALLTGKTGAKEVEAAA